MKGLKKSPFPLSMDIDSVRRFTPLPQSGHFPGRCQRISRPGHSTDDKEAIYSGGFQRLQIPGFHTAAYNY